MELPDPADVAAAAGGDIAAFERLVRHLQGHVWRYLVHLLHDSALAEDTAQEVFLKVHRNLSTLRDPERFVPWLLTIARNAAFDAGRSRQRRPVELIGDREVAPDNPGPDPHIGYEIHDALSRLENDLREALVLVCIVGLAYDEAAETIGVPAGTVKSRVFRARKQMIKLLDLEAPGG